MAGDKRYYGERANELQNDLRKWAEKAAVKMITLSDELKQENIEIGQKLAEVNARIKAINDASTVATAEGDKVSTPENPITPSILPSAPTNVAAGLAPSKIGEQLGKQLKK